MKSFVAKTIRFITKIILKEVRNSQNIKLAPQNDNKYLALLRNKHLGQRCFIIGNGPSLTKEDLEKLKFEYTFASNKIYLLFDEISWRPTYYSSEDRLVVEQNTQKILDVNRTTKLFPEFVKKYLGERNDTFYFKQNFNCDPKDPLKSDNFPGFCTDLTQGTYWGSTITYTQMQLAAYMGFKEIYLIGVDFTYSLPKQKDGFQYISEGERNHFHPDYRKPGERWNQPNLDVHVKSFNFAKEATENLGAKIYNATRGGKLEIFERVDFESLF